MKNLIWILLLILVACAPSPSKESEQEVHPKYKKGDIVCVIEFGVKGIIQFQDLHYHINEPVYSVMFNSNQNELYNLHIYESQLTECQ